MQNLEYRPNPLSHRQRGLGAISDDAVPLVLAVHFDGPADWPGIAGLPDMSLCPVPLRAPAAVIDGDAILPFPAEISIDREDSRTSLSYPGSRLSPGPTYARVNLIVQIYAYFSAYPHLLPSRGHYFVQELSIFEQNWMWRRIRGRGSGG